MKRVLVTGAGGPAGVNFIKSLRLAKEKLYVIGSDANKWHLEVSNADKKYVLPRYDSGNYIEKLNKLIKKEKVQFLHSQPDTEVNAISEHREEINAMLFFPKKETIRLCQDKMKLVKTLEKKRIPVAESFLIKKEKDIQHALDKLLKNSEKAWIRAIHGAGARASLPIVKAAHAEMWIDYWKRMHNISYGDFMLCEYLPGREFAFQSIWKDGELVTSQARERLEYLFGHLTPSGQTSTPAVAKTVHREDINEIATKAVLAVDKNANGVFCIDIKENSSGMPCVTEINAGRFFTTSDFFAEAGINMPYLYLKLAYKERIPDVKKYNPLPANWYWVRLMDCGHALVKGEKWTGREI